jgi:hypothetical protein
MPLASEANAKSDSLIGKKAGACPGLRCSRQSADPRCNQYGEAQCNDHRCDGCNRQGSWGYDSYGGTTGRWFRRGTQKGPERRY